MIIRDKEMHIDIDQIIKSLNIELIKAIASRGSTN